LPRIVFKDWRPDLSTILNPGVEKALNTVPIAGGFGPLPGWTSDSDYSAVANQEVRGTISVRDKSRNSNVFAGTASTATPGEGSLYRWGAGKDAEPVNWATGPYTVNNAGSQRWEFELFGNVVYATNWHDPLQYFDLGISADFDAVANASTPASPYVPRCRHMGVVGQFLILGNYYDGLQGAVPNGLAWGGIGNPLFWPNPLSDDRAAVQSDRQALEGDGGWVMALVGGAEVGAVFRENAIHRMDYRGGSDIFEITKVEHEYGCVIPGAAAAFGRQILFYSEAGWRIFDLMDTRPAGKERVDSWFAADIDMSFAYRARVVADPDSTRIFCSYAGAGHNAAGDPNKLLIYDHALDRFTHGDEAMDCLGRYLVRVVPTMDSPSVPMDNPAFDMDDVGGSAGEYALGGWNQSAQFGAFSGAAKDVTIETGLQNHVPGRVALVNGVRPMTVGDARSTIRIATLETPSKAAVFGKKIPLSSIGHFSARHRGRFHKYRLELAGSDFDNAIGLDVSVRDAGSR